MAVAAGGGRARVQAVHASTFTLALVLYYMLQ